VQCGHTKIMCSVYGPKQLSGSEAEFSEFSTSGKLRCSIKEALFASSKNRFKSRSQIAMDQRVHDRNAAEHSTMMTQALEQAIPLERYPKSTIEVQVLVLESSGGTLAAAIICASLALADAGIEMLDVVTACSSVGHEAGIFVDPLQEEEENASNKMMVTYMPSLKKASQVHQEGAVDCQQALEGIEICIDGCLKLQAVMQECLVQRDQPQDKP